MSVRSVLAGAAELALVAVDLAAAETDRLFTYAVPGALASALVPGVWVEVPFRHRRLIGCYVGRAETAPPGVSLRPVLGLAADLPPLPPTLLELGRWVADQYLCTFVNALRLLVPAAARRGQVRERLVVEWRLTVSPATALAQAADLERRAPAQARVLRALADAGATVSTTADGAALRALARRQLVATQTRTQRRSPFAGPVMPDQPPVLTAEQQAALDQILPALAGVAGRQQVFLLHGVTGSGKTEVYLRAIARAIALGRQAIVLVPEISLTPQTVARFRARFGDRVAVLHSALGEGERWDEWIRIRRGEVDIVIGARSAIFAPFERLGIIIIDEEHEGTYKQDEIPRYHAREVAEERARRAGAALVLGSATPALETYQRAVATPEIALLQLNQRVAGRPLPPVELIDMREELRSGNRSVFSQALLAQLRRCLEDGDQAILFLNRRGFHTFVLCRTCGQAVECPHCAIALTYHMQRGDRLECHWCGHSAAVPRICPSCESKSIRYLGAGTERIEAELSLALPQARVRRLDVDTTSRKGAHGEILDAFARGDVDVLVGTQMVAKGLDFPRVTLVGVVLADVTMNLPDFRAAERTFQLVTQVAGRAGRGERGGRVLVQTYSPDRECLLAAAHHDFTRFFAAEIRLRQALAYPPFAHFLRLVVTGADLAAVTAGAESVRQALDRVPAFPAEVVGPAPAPLPRLRGQWRHHLLLKGQDRAAMVAAARQSLDRELARGLRSLGLRLSIDVGPLSIL